MNAMKRESLSAKLGSIAAVAGDDGAAWQWKLTSSEYEKLKASVYEK